MAKHSTAHPGFKSVEKSMAKRQGVSEKEAGAELASASRNASASAKHKNPNINKVKGGR